MLKGLRRTVLEALQGYYHSHGGRAVVTSTTPLSLIALGIHNHLLFSMVKGGRKGHPSGLVNEYHFPPRLEQSDIFEVLQ